MSSWLIRFLSVLVLASAVPMQVQAAELTAADAQSWLDGLMPTAIRNARVPGAVVVLVKDGKPLIQKGYGHADWQKQTPVDPQATLFRLGSISKLFTWTAVMQLVEQGKLDLDADVNRYLDFAIPEHDGKALTLRHILTHTTGFEETNRDLVTFDGAAAAMGPWLRKHLPARVFAAGSTPGYSNYATTLAGYIVERASGQRFNDYIDQRIFSPLGMQHSTLRQPLPPALQSQMATGYRERDVVGKGFETVNVAPAGSLSATGEDMGRFMLAYLQGGRGERGQLLKPETVRQMHTTVTRALPDLNGMGLGFYQQDVNGHRVVAHGGDTIYFHSDLVLFVDDGIGLFISVNAPGKDNQGGLLRERLFQEFAKRYLPNPQGGAAMADRATALEHGRLIAGKYAATRGSFTNFLSMLSVLSPTTVVANDNGTIQLELGSETLVYAETAQPFLWQEMGTTNKLQAIVKDGKVLRWSLEPYAFAFVFEPLRGLSAAAPMVPLLLGSIAVVLGTALLWPVAAIARRHYGVSVKTASSWPLRAVRLSCLLALVALGLWAWVLYWLGENYTDIPAGVFTAEALSLLAFAGGLAAALWRACEVLKSGHGRWPRAVALLWVAAFAVILAFALDCHLIGFNPNY